MRDENKSERDLLADISAKLDRVAALIAIQGKEQDEQISVLTSLGFDSKAIGLFVGISGDAVRKRRTRNRRQ